MLLVWAMILAGPISPLMAKGEGGCCTMPSRAGTQSQAEPAHACCMVPDADEVPLPADQPEGEHPGCPDDGTGCDCPMPCCVSGKVQPLGRVGVAFDLPAIEPQDEPWAEYTNHAVEARFSLLRPPRV